MKTSLRKLAALCAQAETGKVPVDPDDELLLTDNKYSTTVLKGDEIVAVTYKRSKDLALEEAEQDHLQRMREAGDERPENQ